MKKILATLLAFSTMMISLTAHAELLDTTYYATVEDGCITNYSLKTYSSGEQTLVYYTITQNGVGSQMKLMSSDSVIVILNDSSDTSCFDEFSDAVTVTPLSEYVYYFDNDIEITLSLEGYADDKVYIVEGVSELVASSEELYAYDSIAAVYDVSYFYENSHYSECWDYGYVFTVRSNTELDESLFDELAIESFTKTDNGCSITLSSITSLYDVVSYMYSVDGVYYVTFPTTTATVAYSPQFRCSYVANPNLIGDITGDGVVSVADAITIVNYAMNVTEISDENLESCDLYVDGIINNTDALVLMRYLVEIEEELPVYPSY